MKAKQWLPFALCLSLLTMPMTALADDEDEEEEEETGYYSEDGDYCYGLDDDGNAIIYDFTNDDYEGDLVVPTQIDGHTVVSISNGAYISCSGITSVTIPSSVTDIGNSVFYGCLSLEYFALDGENSYFSVDEYGVLFGDNAQYIIAYPAGSDVLTEYEIPDGVDEIAPGCFAYAPLTTVTMPDTVMFIDSWSFAYSDITSISLSASLYLIDDYAFAYCMSLHEVNLGESIQYIYNASFYNCRALTEILLPDSLVSIGQYAFCATSLGSITIPTTVETLSYCCFGYDSSLEAIESFVIYGEADSTAEDYATTSDEDNDYENNFTFVEVEDASYSAQLAGSGSTGSSSSSSDSTTSDDADSSVSAATSTTSEEYEEASADSITSMISPLFLAICIASGLIVILLIALLVLVAKSHRKKHGDSNNAEMIDETDYQDYTTHKKTEDDHNV